MQDPDTFAVTVYAGSSPDAPEAHLALARCLGGAIARRGWVLVYGGANIGLMGACADAALEAGGRVEGVILDTFSRVAHEALHSLSVTTTMRDRKAGLAHRGDAFVALPGGLGTLEELSEIAVERSLGLHAKPLVLVSPAGFWRPLLEQLEVMADAHMVPPAVLGTLVEVVEDADAAVAAVAALRGRAPHHDLGKLERG